MGLHLARFAASLVLAGATLLGVAQAPYCPSTSAQDAVSLAASAYLAGVRDGSRNVTLQLFYKPCAFALAWSRDARITPQARAIIAILNAAEEKGLRPQDYDAERWSGRDCSRGKCSDQPMELARFDADLTAVVMRYVSDLVYGRVRPINQAAGYTAPPDQEYVARLVWSQIVTAADVPAAIQRLEPQAQGYLRAEAALHRYVMLGRQTPDVALPPFQRVIRPGDQPASLSALTARLQQLGELRPEDAWSSYDGPLVEAIKHFQKSHGRSPTGIIDAGLWRELSIPLSARVNQLAYTLERWRWIPHPLTSPRIVVNIPEFRVRAYNEEGRAELSMAVVVGKAPHRRTPVLQASLTQVTFHPYWNVPRSIQAREIAPLVAKNSSYLTTHDYQVLTGEGKIVPNEGAATLAGIRNGSLRVRQVPGDQNALGNIKFVFPNSYDVYMHGTPQQSLFRRDRRDFSHGCIRVEDPNGLAWWILSHEKDWTKQRVSDSIADPRTEAVQLSSRIPVLVVYGTGVAAEDGTVSFFSDIYGYDKALKKSLDALSRERNRLNSAAW